MPNVAVGDLFAALFLVTIIYVLVRPRSAAAETIQALSNAMVAIVRTVTDM